MEIFRDTGDRHSEGMVWNALGSALAEVERFEEAISAFERDIAICLELGDHYGQAAALENLGLLHAAIGDSQRARQAWVDATQLYAMVGAEDDAARIRQAIAAFDR